MLTVDSAASSWWGETRAAPQTGKSNGFSSMLDAHIAYSDKISGISIPGLAGIVQSENQFFQIQYAPGSTAEDPIIRISGKSMGSSFDYVRHVRDLDPRNVSLPEAYALLDYWQSSTGQEVSLKDLASGWGDFTQRRNILAMGQESLTDIGEDFLAKYAQKLLEDYEESLLNLCKA